DPGLGARRTDWEPDVIGTAHVDTSDGGAVVRERTERAADPWLAVKSRFVDDPTGAAADAEQLVRDAVDDRIRELQDESAAVLASQGEDTSSPEASTEVLRNRLIRYQAYCQRLSGLVH
ncbi:MAG TPA: hypothetical protein VHW23_47250, partial [Kofleriaceae bacterium]|nr:hypothetical protein [Kofleriaceae bacterium]